MTRGHRLVIRVLTSFLPGLNHFLELDPAAVAGNGHLVREPLNINATVIWEPSAVTSRSVTFDSWRVRPCAGKERA